MSSVDESRDYKIPLAELFTLLRASGYEVSVDTMLEVESLLLTTSITRVRLAELKLLITPLIARNRDEQERIYSLIDQWVAARTRSTIRLSRRNWYQHRHTVFVAKLTGVIIIVSTAIFLFFLNSRSREKTPVATLPRVDLPSHPVSTALAKDSAKPKISISKADPEKKVLAADVSYNGRHLMARQADISLQLAAAFGLALGAILYYIIFFERKRHMEARRTQTRGPGKVAAPPTEVHPNKTTSFATLALRLPERSFLIQKPRELSAIVNSLRKPELTRLPNLAIKRSVTATTRNVGFPTAVFDESWSEKTYVILLHKNDKGNQFACLMEWFVELLQRSKVRIQYYTYGSDILSPRDASGNEIDFERLKNEHPNTHLVIIGSTQSLFNAPQVISTESIKTLFHGWRSCSLITPLLISAWSYREEQLQLSDFRVVPADLPAIYMLGKSLEELGELDPSRIKARLREPGDVSQPDLESVTGIRAYLANEDLFQVFCALAIYPQLEWSLTLALVDAFAKKNTGSSVSPAYETLLKLSRIPWLDRAELTESQRAQLLNLLRPESELLAREVIIALLKEASPRTAPGSEAEKELRVQLTINTFYLYAHDPLAYPEYRESLKNILENWLGSTEWSLRQHVDSGLLPLNAKGTRETVEEFVLHEKEFEKSNTNLLRLSLLLVPAAVIYILLSIFKPSFAYLDSFDRVSFITAIRPDNSCVPAISRVVVSTANGWDTLVPVTRGEISYIRLDSVEYRRPVHLSVFFADGSSIEQPVLANDSVATVSIVCR
jgi:hypothetical protein